MSTATWLLGDGETLAAYVPEQAFRSFLSKRLAVPPDRLGILIRDGQIVDALPGAQFSVGGVWSKVKEMVGGKHALRLLVADMKPFRLEMAFDGVTADQINAAADVTLELQFDPERPANLLGLVANETSLTVDDIDQRIRPHLEARVLSAAIHSHQATELRGNTGLQDQIQADVMREVERLAGDLGLLVRAVSVHWGANEEETRVMTEAHRQRADEDADRAVKRRLRDLEREQEATVWQLRADLDLEKIKAGTEADLELFLSDSKLRVQDARDEALRGDERKRLAHEIDLAKQRRDGLRREAMEKVEDQLERTKMDIEMRRYDAEFDAEMRRLRMQTDRMEADQKLELEKRRAEAEFDLGQRGQSQQLDNLGKLQALELEKSRAHHDMNRDDYLVQHSAGMDRDKLQSETELEKLRLQAAMNPDQILAVQAGLSPEVAAVFAERAKAENRNADEKEALLREMVRNEQAHTAQVAGQGRDMFDRTVDRMTEATQAAAGARSPAAPVAPGAPQPPAPPARPSVHAAGAAATVECPNCHAQVPANDRFCKHCGTPLNG